MRSGQRVFPFVAVLFGLVFTLAACAVPDVAAPVPPPSQAVDYAQPDNWAALPATPDKPVDIFLVYPTLYDDPAYPRMDWRVPAQREIVLRYLRKGGGVLADVGNLYAPFYRQANLTEALRSLKGEGSEAALSIGFADVQQAFVYYMEHFNQGRPVILFSHSQGTMAALDTMKALFHQPDYCEKLVAAYLIGYRIAPSDLKPDTCMKFAHGADDVGVIIGYNSQSAEADPNIFVAEGMLGINPLNWRTDNTPAPASQNLGSASWNKDGSLVLTTPGLTGAQLDPRTGALIIALANPRRYEAAVFGSGVYHSGNIDLFYRNLQVNAQQRLEQYQRQKRP